MALRTTVHDFVDVRRRLPSLDGVREASLDVVLEEQQRDLVRGRGERLDLLEHVEAVRLLVDEALDPARLSLDASGGQSARARRRRI